MWAGPGETWGGASVCQRAHGRIERMAGGERRTPAPSQSTGTSALQNPGPARGVQGNRCEIKFPFQVLTI